MIRVHDTINQFDVAFVILAQLKIVSAKSAVITGLNSFFLCKSDFQIPFSNGNPVSISRSRNCAVEETFVFPENLLEIEPF